MHILQKLTLQNLRENRRRTIVTVIGVVLSSALILAVTGMVTSFQKMMLNFAIAETGEYAEMFEEVPVPAIKYITDNQHVSSYFFSPPVTAETIGAEAMETYQDYPHAPYTVADYEKLSELPASADGKYNVYVNYDRPRDYVAIHDQILNALESATGEAINLRTNSNLLRAYGVVSDQALNSIYWLTVIIIGIIVVTSVFVIRNGFSISATERSRQFGMLSSIGATPRQIRHSVIFEGVAISLISIPLGLILGAVAVAILVVVVNYLLHDMMVAPLEFSLPLWIFPAVILLSFITVFASSLISAIRAGRMSAIDAIRGNHDIKIKPRRLHTSKLVQQTFGIGGVIAAKNLKRSRKKYRTTVASIVLSVATFIGLSSFLAYGKKTIDLEYQNSNVEAIITGGDNELYQDLTSKFHLKDYAYYEATYSNDDFQLVLMNTDSFAEFARSVGIKSGELDRVAIANNTMFNLREDGGYELTTNDKIHEGEDYQLQLSYLDCHLVDLDGEKYNSCQFSDSPRTAPLKLPITKVTTMTPLGFEDQIQPTIFIPENYYQRAKIISENFDPTTRQLVATNVPDLGALDEYMTAYQDQNQGQVYYHNIVATRDRMQRMILLMEIFLYGFIIVVTLIGVTNIFNTITTNIALRAREFAILKSVGMTDDEFKRMVRLESLMYSGKALVIGVPIGVLLAYGIYRATANSVDFGFIFPWLPILGSIVAVSLLVIIIMRYSVRQVEKQNIIETIRSENI